MGIVAIIAAGLVIFGLGMVFAKKRKPIEDIAVESPVAAMETIEAPAIEPPVIVAPPIDVVVVPEPGEILDQQTIMEEIPPRASIVKIALKNPPAVATTWRMRLVNWNITKDLNFPTNGEHGNIAETAVFEIPADWSFPLRFDISIDQEWEEADGWHARGLYHVQSVWVDRKDYKEVFFHRAGNYYYDIVTEGEEER